MDRRALPRVLIDHAAVAIVVMLLASTLLGAGMLWLEQSPGLDQFEFDTEEGDALDEIQERFAVADDETAVQIVVRDRENALSRSSFLETIGLQADLRDDSAVNETLTDDPFADLASVVATDAIRADEREQLEDEQDRIDRESALLEESFRALEADAAALEDEGEALEAAFDDLNQSVDALENDSQALEEQRTALEADEAILQNRAETLAMALEETATIQTRHEAGELDSYAADAAIEDTWTDAQHEAALDAEQNASFRTIGADVRTVATLEFDRETAIDTGPTEITNDPEAQAILRDALNETVDLHTAYDEADNEADRAAINASIEEIWDDASSQAYLSAEQDAAFRELGWEVRELTTTINEIGPLPALIEAGSAGVLADEIDELERRGDDLAADAAALEERGEELEARGADLEAWGADLEARGEMLDRRGAALEDQADELAERGDALADGFAGLGDVDPTIAEQRAQLETMNDSAVEELVTDLLGEGAPPGLLAFVPTDYDPGNPHTDARTLVVTQTTEADEIVEGDAPPRIVDSQLAIAAHVDERFGADGFAFGVGIITDEINRSMTDSLAIVVPLALLFVVVVLTIAYRDPLDILLGVAGIGLVLVWTFGFMGWTGIVFNQIMIAVPVLLVGLSIDYAIHVFMRHRERRAEEHRDSRTAMTVVLIGLGVALVWVTITAMIGFLANLVSPVPPIREFGIVSAAGIASTLLIFGVLVPASKVVLDDWLESRGWDRRRRAFGTGGGRLTAGLRVGNRLAQRVPVVVVLLALLLTTGGAYAGMQVDTEFNQEDFIADEPAAWMDRLPEIVRPGDYSVKTNLDFVNERFLRHDANTQVLVRGDVTADDALQAIDAAEDAAGTESVVVTLSDGSADVRSPLSAMRETAAANERFNETFTAADTTGDDVPDQNLTGVYDAFFAADADTAGQWIAAGTDGYDGLRLELSIRGDASPGDATDATRSIATLLEGTDRTAVATGQLVVFHVIEDALFTAVIESLLVTLVVVVGFLAIAYRLTNGSAILGLVTLTPIVLTVAWILGTMYLLDIPFNVITGTITSLTVGLGVAYNIHISERYRVELDRGHDIVDAMDRAVTGTGGALLGSAATTVGGFGVLIVAILPPLQQFGLITGITIIYAFLGSVLVLPSLLVLWTRYLAPDR